MGLYKLCGHRGRARDRCEHAWWASFKYKGRLYRTSLPKWTNRKIDTKEKALIALEDLRRVVRAGTFHPAGVEPAESKPHKGLTFREFARTYVDKHVKAKNLSTADAIDYRLKPILAHFGDRVLADIRTADVEDFIAALKKPRADSCSLAPASVNRTIQLLRHMFNWALEREYIDRTPFRRGTATLIRLEQEDNKRRRRISEDEEAKLLAVAPPRLRSMIVTALDTGMRRGEMLALRFDDVDLDRGVIVLRGETTKSGKTRVVPIATLRLKAVFKWLRLDIDGTEKNADALVFADEDGERLVSFRRAWVTAVLKAHGVKPEWAKGTLASGTKKKGWKELAPACRAAFQRIDLHWHDLRHEYASRLVERGVPLSQVRDLLGHASITTTERYDNQAWEALQAAAMRLENGKAFDGSPQRESDSDHDAVAEPTQVRSHDFTTPSD